MLGSVALGLWLLQLVLMGQMASAESPLISAAMLGEALHGKSHLPQRPRLATSENWLERWLENLVVTIPPITNMDDGKRHSLYYKFNGTCGRFQLEHVRTSRTGLLTNLTAVGLAASCTLDWYAKQYFLPSSSGRVHADVADSFIGGPIGLQDDGAAIPMPKAILTGKCGGTFNVSVDFKGGVVSWVLQKFKPVIEGLLGAQLGKIICKQVDGALDDQGSKLLKNFTSNVSLFLQSNSSTPSGPGIVPKPTQDYVKFSSNPGIVMVQDLFLHALAKPESKHNINEIVREQLGPGASLTLGSMKGLLPIGKTIVLEGLGEINATLLNLTLTGLDTWSLSKLGLQTPDPYQVGLSFGLDNVGLVATIKLQIAPSQDSPLKGGTLDEVFNMNATLKQFSIGAFFFAAVNQKYLGTLAVNQLASYGGIAAAVHSARLSTASMKLPTVDFALTPINSDVLENDVDLMINSVAKMLLDQFAPTLDAVANHSLAVPLRDAANNAITKTLQDAPQCPAPEPTYTSDFAVAAGATAATCFLVLAVVLLPIGVTVRDRIVKKPRVVVGSDNQVSGRSWTSAVSDQPLSVDQEAQVDDTPRESSWDCLAFHPRTHPILRWGLSCLGWACVGAMVAANSIVATTVNVSLEANGEPVAHLPRVFGFSLASSVREFYQSKVYFLFLVVLIFSGIWPYVKLMLMQFCWFAPTRWLSSKRRLDILDFLDTWGKLSLIDAFVMVLFMVAFKFDLQADSDLFPQIKSLFEEAGASAGMHVYVESPIGFHLFVLATLGSLTTGHFMTATHRYALKLGEYSEQATDGEARRLCNVMRPEGYWKGKMFVYGPVVGTSAALLLVAIGLWLDTFSFTFFGAAGFVLGPKDRVRSFSVISLGMAIPSASNDPSSFGVHWLQVFFLVFGVFAVLAYYSILLVLWCAPLSSKLQRRFYVAAQILNAWSGLDVFVFSVLAAVLELPQLTSFIVGDKCDVLNKLLAVLPFADQIPGEKVCFDVETELLEGFYVLGTSALLSTVVGHLMLARCKKALCSAQSRSSSSRSLANSN